MTLALRDSLPAFGALKEDLVDALTVGFRTLLNDCITVLDRMAINSSVELVNGIVEPVGGRRAYSVGHGGGVGDARERC